MNICVVRESGPEVANEIYLVNVSVSVEIGNECVGVGIRTSCRIKFSVSVRPRIVTDRRQIRVQGQY